MTETSHRTALITGASSGIGAEFAHQLAARGYDLILVARREERLEELCNTVTSKFGVRAEILPADLADMTGIQHVIQVITEASDLELLVNNAGLWFKGRFYRADPEKELTLMQVHMVAPVLLCRAALPGMVARKSGWIINVSSLAGFISTRSVLYDSSKTFLIRFSEILQAELRDTGVKVQALCPGFISTEFFDTPEFTNFSRQRIPRYLWVTSQQVVNASLAAMSGQKVVCIPGNIYKIIGFLARNSFTAGFINLLARILFRRPRRLIDIGG